MPASEKGLETLASLLKKDGSNVVFMVGAGISTSCGIPDFRSPKTGLYSNLQKLGLPYAEAVFDIEYFRKNPKAFYTLAGELYPGKFKPSPFHYFIKLLQDKNKLKRVYTQNIDTLERIAGVEDEYIVEAHGSFAQNHCIDCKTEMASEELKKQMETGIPTCLKCKGYVKPDIVFFGEALPIKFFDKWDDDSAEGFDIAIVAGTGLAVYPFASLPEESPKDSLRVLINREKCGSFLDSPREKDVVLLGYCDDVIFDLCEQLGWKEELDKLISGDEETEEKEKSDNKNPGSEVEAREEKSEAVESETEKVSKRIAEEVAEAEKSIPAEKVTGSKDKDSDNEDVDGLADELEKVAIKP